VGNLNVSVDPSTNLILARRISDGKVLLNQTATFSAPPIGYRNATEGAFSAKIQFAGHGPDEVLFGFGEQRQAQLRRIPFFSLFENDQRYPVSYGGQQMIPLVVSGEGYAMLWNMPSYGYVNISSEGQQSWFSNGTLMVDFWIAATPLESGTGPLTAPYGELLHRYALATGRPPVLPDYALGFIQCKNRYRNQSQLLDVARGYFNRKLPVSLIVIDYHHWPALGDWRFTEACWPDPQGMVDELRSMGMELMVSMWPEVDDPSDTFKSFDAEGFLIQNSSTGESMPFSSKSYTYDSTSALARDAVFSKMKEGYLKYGIKTFWLDADEPQHDGLSQDTDGYLQGAGAPLAEVGEAWVLEHHRMVAEGLQETGIQSGDFMALTRSAWAGSQRYGVATWSGDIHSTFDELALQVVVGQGVAFSSGGGAWTTDTGGYKDAPPNTDPMMQQLITRWMQFSLFTPLMRIHGNRAGGPPSNPTCGETNGPNEVWTYGPEIEPILSGLIHLRNSLLPYVQSLSVTASLTGIPMMRPMILQFPDDPRAAACSPEMESQFMFGPDWVVAPVLAQDVTHRSIYLPVLPEGQEWAYMYNASMAFHGG